MGRAFAQTMAGKSKDRQALADRALPFEIRVVPVALSGDLDLVKRVLSQRLSYARTRIDAIDETFFETH